MRVVRLSMWLRLRFGSLNWNVLRKLRGILLLLLL